ncbi:cytochrome C [Polynucleobacter wuianus]|uniref:Cytochrome C n=1 Tax=Polynucleobacter wuianus TaxID=1743168 RepID=A0A191UG85_9BURK|nr:MULTISPECIES: cytochrome c [Polynucleobacter]ANJ00024.1 cytochrome C [Polynucleobacter wuianus]MBU3552858.1 cytochrome c [Polynucleobacter sp. MWH-Post4-6-1]MBU3610382.1 cytochrome c [Polynucleobacter wuianus]
MKLQKILLAGTATVLAIAAGTAIAQFQKPEDAIKYRQSAFTVMANSFGKIGAVVKGEAPYNKDEVAKNAAIVAMMSTLPWQAFGPGTEGGKAQPEVWSDNAKFKAASEKMQLAVADLNKAAQSGDLESIKKTFGAAGASCKGCHDDFKKK